MNSEVFQVFVLIITGLGAVAMFFMAYTFNRGTRDKDKNDEVLREIFNRLNDMNIQLVKLVSNDEYVKESLRNHKELIAINANNIESLKNFKHKVENDRDKIIQIIDNFEEKLKEKK